MFLWVCSMSLAACGDSSDHDGDVKMNDFASNNGASPTSSLGVGSSSSTLPPSTATPLTTTHSLGQIDGSTDVRSHIPDMRMGHAFATPSQPHPFHLNQQRLNVPRSVNNTQALPSYKYPQAPINAITDLLPYCTTGAPLSEAQVIALTDVAGSLKELALLALSAASGEQRAIEKLEGAVGRQGAVGVVEFFTDEWQVAG